MKKFFGALLLVVAIVLAVTAVQTNFSLVASGIVDLTLFVHVVDIIAVILVIFLNQNIVVDYIACATLLISVVKPANTVIVTYIGKIDGIAGAVVPVVGLIAVVLCIAFLFYAAYKTNKIAVGKGLVVVISALCFAAAIIVGFVINAIAASNGIDQIGLIAEGALATATTVLMVISFFLTKEDLAKVAIIVAVVMTWFTMINQELVTKAVEKVMSIKSYTIKGIIPIVLGIVFFELGKSGIKCILAKESEVTQDEDDDDEETEK